MLMLTESEKKFIKLVSDIPVLQIEQSPHPIMEWKYKRPDFLISIDGVCFFVEVKSGNPGQVSGEEYHRLLNTSLAFNIAVIIVWIGEKSYWSLVDGPVHNDGTVFLEFYPLTNITDIVNQPYVKQILTSKNPLT